MLREYYINDAGSQILTLLKSAYLRYLQACGQDVEIGEGLYPGQYLVSIGEDIKTKFGLKLQDLDEDKALLEIRDFVVESNVG